MKQFIQNLKTGALALKELPIPLCKSKGALVRTVSSLVSVGTEKSIIDLAQKGLIGKARARQAGEIRNPKSTFAKLSAFCPVFTPWNNIRRRSTMISVKIKS